MMGGFKPEPTRRAFLKASLLASGALLVGFEKISWLEASEGADQDVFTRGKQLGVLDFVGESRAPLDTLYGTDLDGRLYTDLSSMTPENPVTPPEKFYIRTRPSELLDSEKPWLIKLGGLVKRPLNLSMEELNRLAKPAGLHLMECAGNARVTRFAMLSVADWAGAPVSEVLEMAGIAPQATRVLISGFDRYLTESTTSAPGADWIFTPEELRSSRAFLATEMNGRPLTREHGAPVRLLVPGWYGCTCIKWVQEIRFVGEDAAATSQMQEFAKRTHQSGVPSLAKDYRPASIDQAAMPIRIEKWLVDEKIKYCVVGILWGGSRPVNVLEIRFNPEEDYAPVDSFKQTINDPWSFWTHAWTPKKTGTYMIRLRVKDPPVSTRRLDSGYYLRSVEVTEV
ncbi:MAG: molybdopterin-dependent oxidoreductase [Candidatus Acidiferrales bacterium]